MIPRRCFALGLTFAGALLFAIPASSAPRHVEVLPANTPIYRVADVAGTCALGTVGEPAQVGVLYPPDDTYLTLIRPTTCGSCSVTALSNVRLSLEFRKVCSVPVAISVVRAFGTTCPQPDQGQVVFPAFSAVLTPTEIGVTEFVVPVPIEWRLDADAFLAVHFNSETDSCSAEGEQPRIALRAGCPRCIAYENFAGSTEDVCESGVGLPLMSVDVSECVPTPVARRSWGSLKIRYR